MKLSAPARVLSAALTAAANLTDSARRRNLPAPFEAICLNATAVGTTTVLANAGAATAFAISDETARYYLTGLHLRGGSALTLTATNGHQLVRVTHPQAADLGGAELIIPRAAIKTLDKLITADKAVARILLRCSKTLVAFAAGPHIFTSKLIDAAYPDVTHVITAPSSSSLVVGRIELAQAVERLEAIAFGDKAPAPVGLEWSAGGEPALRVSAAGYPAMASDEVTAAKLNGAGRISISLSSLAEFLEEYPGAALCLDMPADRAALRITNPENSRYVAMLSTIRWPLDHPGNGGD